MFSRLDQFDGTIIRGGGRGRLYEGGWYWGCYLGYILGGGHIFGGGPSTGFYGIIIKGFV